MYCALFILINATGCTSGRKVDYIDYIKVSDNTFLGISEEITGLDVPWDIQFNESTNSIFFTEIKGQISELDLETGEKKVIYTVPNVYHKRTLGLLGMAIHPDFKNQPYLYVCYTTKVGDQISSELAKLHYHNGLVDSSRILLKIEGATGHNGSRLVFDKKDLLYWATGDAHSETHAQDSTTLNGKVLRMTADGKIPSDNPIRNSYVYAWGFRNIQGMSFTDNGNLFTSEHGDAIEDEINLVKPLNNYGWKEIEGFHDTEKEKEIARKSPRTEPVKAWTPVIAPAAIKYYNSTSIPEWQNALILGTLKSQSLRVLKLNSSQTNIVEEYVYLKDYYGRIRAITADKSGNIYIATSNKDWNPQKGFPRSTDDRILKISKIDFVPKKYLEATVSSNAPLKDGKSLYQAYCASCHKEDGNGVAQSFPPLRMNASVKDEQKLIHSVLEGVQGEIIVNGEKYNQVMPSFKFLSNGDIASILTYVRSNFGNNYSAIDSSQVAKLKTK